MKFFISGRGLMFEASFTAVREKAPLVHNITNYVTVNDVANILLACGASPIMSDEPEDVVDITSVCAVGLAGEIGYLHMKEEDGNSTYRNRIIDAICHMNKKVLKEEANDEIR